MSGLLSRSTQSLTLGRGQRGKFQAFLAAGLFILFFPLQQTPLGTSLLCLPTGWVALLASQVFISRIRGTGADPGGTRIM
jgi:hypothetical protein